MQRARSLSARPPRATTQRIVYDQASGAIYFDADGFGGKAQVQFAKVAAGTALTAAHFQLFTL